MPRFRFTVRWLMVVVAIAGGMFFGYRLHRRSEAFQLRAEWEFRLAEVDERAGFHGERPNREWWDHHRAMWRKYGRAARYPWLSVSPDPPDPEMFLWTPFTTGPPGIGR